MRYFLDTEFNGFAGALLSIALVPEEGEEFYAVLECGVSSWLHTSSIRPPRRFIRLRVRSTYLLSKNRKFICTPVRNVSWMVHFET